ncbi:MAG: hypothetical protein LBL90_08755 [Prevotellaceae bacterium]|jgi:hypothetical protein|nr:hypothetical protein [Prevotellaceae bacterium]
MRRRYKISKLHPTQDFTEFDIFQDYRQSFFQRGTGKIHGLFPFREFAQSLGMKEYSLGSTSCFSPKGEIALTLLKLYSCSPDKDLPGRLNANILYQVFAACGSIR